MLFNSQPFILLFLPLVLALYYAAAAHRALRQSVVIVASLVFYGWWDVRFVPLLAGLTVANWVVAQAFGRWRGPAILIAGVAHEPRGTGLLQIRELSRRQSRRPASGSPRHDSTSCCRSA